MNAMQQLRSEHEGIKVMLKILEQVCKLLEAGGSLNKEHFDGILDFLKVFVDKCHHGKEEDLLFPVMITAGVPKDGHIAMMLEDHATGRKYVEAMSDAYAAHLGGNNDSHETVRQNALAYISLLREHIEKENNILFVMAESFLSEITQDELVGRFEKIEEERIGVGRHEEFHSLLDKLSKIYLSKN
jgi:hemerythrin-like domain-containing protein